MRYPASEKLEIIQLVEQCHLSVRRTLAQFGIPSTTFYRWYDRYRTGGPEALEDRHPKPNRVWNRIPDAIRAQLLQLALDEPERPPRELAVRFTDQAGYFVSEASVYRLLKAHDLITSPAFVVIKAADAFKDKTTAPNQLWQTDFTYLKVIGWGWFYLSTVLDDFSPAEDLLAFFELQGEFADQVLEPGVLAFEPALALWGAGRLERFGGVGEKLVAPLIVLRLAYLMLGTEIADRPALEAFEHDQRLLLWLPLASLHGCPPWSRQPRPSRLAQAPSKRGAG